MDRRKPTGRRGEDIAAAYLLEKGCRVVARNWTCSTGELDIIAEDGDTVIFVEVRTRHGNRFGTAEESVTPAKQARLVELAQTYFQDTPQPHPPWRIDVIAIQLEQGLPQINHIENAVGW
jgi:putative endonuclease